MRDGPSTTAEAVCFIRASDQRRRPDARIVDDPYARLFLGPVLRAALTTVEISGRLGEKTERYLPGVSTFVLTRHRFIDDHLVAALEAGAEQVVLLGAGYDTRGHRFAEQLGSRRVFEVDHPGTGARKARVVERHRGALPAADITRVAVDFEADALDERLVGAGFVEGAPTFVVWEGVSMYLTREALKGTLRTLRRLTGPGSSVAMDFWFLLDDPSVLSTAYRMSANLLHFLGEPITFGIHPEDVTAFLQREGLGPVEVAEAAELERRYVPDDRRVYPATFVVHAALR